MDNQHKKIKGKERDGKCAEFLAKMKAAQTLDKRTVEPVYGPRSVAQPTTF